MLASLTAALLTIQLQIAALQLQQIAYADVFTPPAFTQDHDASIEYWAAIYGVDAEQMKGTIKCETGGSDDPSIQSWVPKKGGPNDREDSWGIAQINLPAHTDITKEQAQDPDFSVKWMARQFSLGNNRIWTCYRNLYPIGATPTKDKTTETKGFRV